MIQEIYESDYIEMGSNSNANSGSTDDGIEHLSTKRITEHVWRDIVDYCRNYYERQTSHNS